MPKPKTEFNKELRKSRKEAGLTELRLWVTSREKAQVETLIKLMRAGERLGMV